MEEAAPWGRGPLSGEGCVVGLILLLSLNPHSENGKRQGLSKPCAESWGGAAQVLGWTWPVPAQLYLPEAAQGPQSLVLALSW